MNDVIDFVERHLAADAELAVAALGEPDDDSYLVVEGRARAFYAPAESRPGLGPMESRFARPGGSTPTATIDVSGSVAAGPLYAVGAVSDDAWIALVGGKRDPGGTFVAEALLVALTDEGLAITGRAEWDSLSDGLELAHVGGDPVDLDAVDTGVVLREPVAPEHAALVRRWAP